MFKELSKQIYLLSDGSDSDSSQVCRPIPVMRSLDGWVTPGRNSNTLRPWLKTGTLFYSKFYEEMVHDFVLIFLHLITLS